MGAGKENMYIPVNNRRGAEGYGPLVQPRGERPPRPAEEILEDMLQSVKELMVAMSPTGGREPLSGEGGNVISVPHRFPRRSVTIADVYGKAWWRKGAFGTDTAKTQQSREKEERS